jgi:NADH dehydrogenase (ubiquinone) Fe-S protein 3
VNPANKYKDKAEGLHKYGQYLMSCLPKYVQQCVTQTFSFDTF